MIEMLKNKYKDLIDKVYKKLKSSNNPRFETRFYHSLGVAKACVELAINIGLSEEMQEKAYVTGIIHDYCKYEKLSTYKSICELNNLDIEVTQEFKPIYHSILAPYIIKSELKIDDKEILDAISCHAMGKPNMNDLEKILFLADYIEQTRVGEHFMKARKIAFENIDKGVFFVCKNVLSYLVSSSSYIHPMSVETYNYYKE